MGSPLCSPGLSNLALSCILGLLVSNAQAQSSLDYQGQFVGSLTCLPGEPRSAVDRLCFQWRVRWRVWTLMGEPVHVSELEWKIDDVLTRFRGPQGELVDWFQATPAMRTAAEKLELTLTLDAGVLRERGAWLRLDTGAPTRPGKTSLNVPGSPSWARLMHSHTPRPFNFMMAHNDGESCETDLSSFVSPEDAKRRMRTGLELSSAQLCSNLSRISNDSAVFEAADAACALRQGPPSWCRREHKSKLAFDPFKSAKKDEVNDTRADGKHTSTAGRAFDPFSDEYVSRVEPVDPTNARGLTEALRKGYATVQPGALPQPSTPIRPQIRSTLDHLTTSNGAAAPVPFACMGSVELAFLLIEVEGSSHVLRVPRETAEERSCRGISVLRMPTGLKPGNFCLRYAVEDLGGRVSNHERLCMKAVSVGSGDAQVSLSWDRAGADIDLHVEGPHGFLVNYRQPRSGSATLDRDDRQGTGPENVYWSTSPAEGVYTVRAHYFGGTGRARVVASVNLGASVMQANQGELAGRGDSVVLFRFRRTATGYELLP